LGPLHAPDALHDDAFDDDHWSVVLPLTVTAVGLALKLNVGGGADAGPALGFEEELDWPVPTLPPQPTRPTQTSKLNPALTKNRGSACAFIVT